MSTFLSAWTLILKRSLAHWRLLSPVILGIVLAVAISSSTVLYFQTLRGLGLSNNLAGIPTEERSIRVRLALNSPSPADYGEVQRSVSSIVAQTMGWVVTEEIRSGRSSTFYVRRPDEEIPPLDMRLRGSLQFLTDPEKHVEVVEGRMPQPVTASKRAPLVIEGAISEPAASLSGVAVGETLIFTPHWEDETEEVLVQVVGLIRPTHGSQPLWEAGALRLTRQLSIYNSVPLLVPEETYFQGMAPLFPKANTSASWTLVTDISRIQPANAESARAGLAILRNTLAARYLNFKMETPLEDLLDAFQTKLFFMRVPLLVVTLMMVAVVLYYVVLMANLLVERQRGEVALIQSRGASSQQILLMYTMEGFLLSGLALAVGPPLAAGAISLLGFTAAFAPLSGGGFLPVHLSAQAFQMGLLGAGLTQAAILLPSIRASRLGMVSYKQEVTRPAQAPLFQRYYLDLGLLGVTALLLWQLENQRSLVVAEGVLGEMKVDQLLLLMPSLFLVAISALFLRLFPLALSGLGRLLGSVAPVWFALGLWELGRNPAHYGRLVLLLMMAAGLGVFAASFGATLDRSYRERALYEAGSEIRVSDVRLDPLRTDIPVTESYQAVTGVETAAPALRGGGSVLSRSFDAAGYSLLAIDPETFADVAWFRPDFSGSSLGELLALLGDAVPRIGIPLPPESERLRLWAQPVGVDSTTSLWAQVRDSNGRYFLYNMGGLDFDEWRELEVLLAEPADRRFSRNDLQTPPAHPLRLMSLFVRQERRTGGQAPGALLLDDIRVRIQGGGDVLIEGFEAGIGWGPLRVGSDAAQDRVDVTPVSPTGEGSSGLFLWEEGQAVFERGLAPGLDRTPVPALASPSFLTGTGHRIGDIARVTLYGREVLTQIREAVAFFPTLDPQEEFLIVPLEPVLERNNVARPFVEAQPNEFWLQVTPGVDRAALAEQLRTAPFSAGTVTDQDALLTTAQADPLVAAGWGALLLIAYLSVLLLSIIGFIVHAYVSAQQRRVIFASLRGLGLSIRQLMGLVWFEHALIIVVGLAFGTWMGGRIGSALLPFLGHTEEGARVLPPFIIETDWGAVALIYLGMGLVFALIIGLIIWVVSRLAIFRALRVGEV